MAFKVRPGPESMSLDDPGRGIRIKLYLNRKLEGGQGEQAQGVHSGQQQQAALPAQPAQQTQQPHHAQPLAVKQEVGVGVLLRLKLVERQAGCIPCVCCIPLHCVIHLLCPTF